MSALTNGGMILHIKKGYTLVELLVVVAIIGILTAIAIPQFMSYREQSYCVRIKNDLASLARQQESYFIENETYLAATRNPDGSSNVPNQWWSPGVVIDSATGGVNGWTLVVSHPNCSKGPYAYDSSGGGIQ